MSPGALIRTRFLFIDNGRFSNKTLYLFLYNFNLVFVWNVVRSNDLAFDLSVFPFYFMPLFSFLLGTDDILAPWKSQPRSKFVNEPPCVCRLLHEAQGVKPFLKQCRLQWACFMYNSTSAQQQKNKSSSGLPCSPLVSPEVLYFLLLP